MTKEELLRENQELKDRIIELQSEVIRLQSQPIPANPGSLKKEISPFELPQQPHCPAPPLPPSYVGDPLPTPHTTDPWIGMTDDAVESP